MIESDLELNFSLFGDRTFWPEAIVTELKEPCSEVKDSGLVTLRSLIMLLVWFDWKNFNEHKIRFHPTKKEQRTFLADLCAKTHYKCLAFSIELSLHV